MRRKGESGLSRILGRLAGWLLEEEKDSRLSRPSTTGYVHDINDIYSEIFNPVVFNPVVSGYRMVFGSGRPLASRDKKSLAVPLSRFRLARLQ